jgi:hypothetical protein
LQFHVDQIAVDSLAEKVRPRVPHARLRRTARGYAQRKMGGLIAVFLSSANELKCSHLGQGCVSGHLCRRSATADRALRGRSRCCAVFGWRLRSESAACAEGAGGDQAGGAAPNKYAKIREVADGYRRRNQGRNLRTRSTAAPEAPAYCRRNEEPETECGQRHALPGAEYRSWRWPRPT